jgi:hypothetical protein
MVKGIPDTPFFLISAKETLSQLPKRAHLPDVMPDSIRHPVK